jgi:16S rRNA (cytosine1402-N4)-methyltransferase
VLDCTIGTAGHARAILDKIGPSGLLVGIDCDEEALKIAKQVLANFENVKLIHANFRDVSQVLNDLGIKQIDAAFFDLGVSSLQLDTPERGFSIRFDAPLDMRMDRTIPLSAYDLVNNLTEEELDYIFSSFGQERWHSRIARSVVKERGRHAISSTKELAAIVVRAIPYKKTYWHIHPATRTFQALRIAVNQELDSLSRALDSIIYLLKRGGKIAIISFHSLEDRIVKEKFRYFLKKEVFRVITKKPLTPQDRELEDNPRSRSAKLRVAERL